MDALVARAQDGDSSALGTPVEQIQDRVYALSLRMLGQPSDAEDAAQEILVKVITRIGGFRRVTCHDVGLRCGGWGQIVLEFSMEERSPSPKAP